MGTVDMRPGVARGRSGDLVPVLLPRPPAHPQERVARPDRAHQAQADLLILVVPQQRQNLEEPGNWHSANDALRPERTGQGWREPWPPRSDCPSARTASAR